MRRTAEFYRHQLGGFLALVLGAAGLVAVLLPEHRALFRPYFGSLPPLAALALVALGGAVSLRTLLASGAFRVFKASSSRRGLPRAALLALPFLGAIVALDVVAPYPPDLNAPLPAALAFYPAMGLVAEVVFHLVPPALASSALGRLPGGATHDRRVHYATTLAASVEPTVQRAFASVPLSGAGAFEWGLLFAFGLVQLRLFRRYDFVTALAFRYVYYAGWHVAWGAARLAVLY